MTSESSAQRSIWLALGRLATLFRLNTGKAWLSSGAPKRLTDGSVLLPPGSRPVALGFGLASGDPVVGAGDLIGYTTVVVTPEMVGAKVAVFTSVECKRPGGDGQRKGRTSKEQLHWRDVILSSGGIAGVASTPDEALSIVSSYSGIAAGVRTTNTG